MITHKEAVNILETMLRIRYSEEIIAENYSKGHMKCPVHLYTGQEAVAAGICLNLLKEDYVTTNHRSHGHYIAKGGDIRLLFNELICLPSGCSGGWGGSQHLYAPDAGILGTSAIVGGGIAVGTGIAYGLNMKKSKNISVVFMGDGATEEGYFYECLNFAALKRLPVLYVCENNGLATHSRIDSRRPKEVKIHKIAESMGIKSVSVDGNDTAGIYEYAGRIIDEIRENQRPHFIEAVTYRWKGHVSPDEDCGDGYRTRDEVDAWKAKCPVTGFIGFSLEKDLLTYEDIVRIRETVKEDIVNMFNAAMEELNHDGCLSVPKTPY